MQHVAHTTAQRGSCPRRPCRPFRPLFPSRHFVRVMSKLIMESDIFLTLFRNVFGRLCAALAAMGHISCLYL